MTETGKSKKKQTKYIRNILAQPYKQHWPDINDEQARELISEIKKSLPAIKIQKEKCPWKELKSLSKEERKKKIQDFKDKKSEENPNDSVARKLRKEYFRLGINDVSRGIESKSVISCLIHGEVNPKMLVKHIVQSACHANIPILIMPNLKGLTKDTVGFPCLTLALKDTVLKDESKQFLLVHNLIKTLWENIKTKMIRMPLEEPEEESEKETSDLSIKINELISPKPKPTYNPFINQSIETIHLTRTTNDYRVFHPQEDAKSDESDTEKGNIKIDFNTENLQDKITKQKLRYYIPPTIHRVQSNPKKKRKMKK